MEGVFSAAEIAEIKQTLEEVIERDRKRGVRLQGFGVDRDELNKRVLILPGKHAKFRELIEHPVVLSYVHEMCSERMQIHELYRQYHGSRFDQEGYAQRSRLNAVALGPVPRSASMSRWC